MVTPNTLSTPTALGAAEAQIYSAISYIEQCAEDGRTFAVITARHAQMPSAVIDRLVTHAGAYRIAQVLAPTDSAHTFLEAIMVQLGFDSSISDTDDLQRLLSLVLNHRQGASPRTLVVMDQAQDFGPRVFEAIRILAQQLHRRSPALMFVLAGTHALDRVLDSKGMSPIAFLTRERFDLGIEPLPKRLDRQSFSAKHLTRPAAPGDASTGELVVTLDGLVMGRYEIPHDRLLIGRSPHNHVTIVSRYISRHHALIAATPEGTWLVDLNSRNGTFVNSTRVHHCLLKPDDIIAIGNYRLSCHVEAPSATKDADVLSRGDFGETMVMRSVQGIGASESTA